MRTLLPVLLAASAATSLSMFASDARIEARVDARIRVTVAAIYDSLDREGITGEPLLQYALEGTEKRARPELILAGVRRWAKDLRRSRRILGPDATSNEISSGAKALRGGLSEKQLQRVRMLKGARYQTARGAKGREAPDGARCQTARDARRREMPDGAKCQTARNAKRREMPNRATA